MVSNQAHFDKSTNNNFLSSLSNNDLILETHRAVRKEREATAVVVRYLEEIDSRKLYLEHACSSLFQFATEKLGYCAGSAHMRIQAMRIVREMPEVEMKLESGELSLTAAAKAEALFQLEKKTNQALTIEEKREVLDKCYGKSTREVERELAKLNPEIARYETTKPVGHDRFQLSFSISEELEGKIRKLKGLLAHSNPTMTNEELLEKVVELGLEKFDPVRKAERAERRKSDASFRAHEIDNAAGESDIVHALNELHAHEMDEANQNPRSRFIPTKVRNEVWLKNLGTGCEFVSAAGEVCGSHHALQIDHIHGFARGGAHETKNLRVLCAKHNRFVWKANLAV